MALREGPGLRQPTPAASASSSGLAAPINEEPADLGEAESPSPDTTGCSPRGAGDTDGRLCEPEAMGKMDAVAEWHNSGVE